MHGEVIDEKSGLCHVVEVCQRGRAEEHDDVPLSHEHHLALERMKS